MGIEAEVQVRWKLDRISLVKMAKGAGYAALYGAAVFVLSMVNGLDLGNALLNGIVVQLVPTLLNSLKEWHAGVQ